MSPEEPRRALVKELGSKERTALERIRRSVDKKRLALAMLITMKVAEGLNPNAAHAESANDYDPLAGMEASPEDETGPEAQKRHEEKRAELQKRIKEAHAPAIEGAKPLYLETALASPDGKTADSSTGSLKEAQIESLGSEGIAITFVDARHKSDVMTATSVDGGEPERDGDVDVTEKDETAVWAMPDGVEFKGEPLTFEVSGVGSSRADALVEALRAAGHHLDAETDFDATSWESVTVVPEGDGQRQTTKSEDVSYSETVSTAYLRSFRIVGEAPTVGEDGKVTVHIEATGYGKTMLETPEAAE